MFIKNFKLAIIWGILVFVFSVIPGNYLPKVKSFADWLSIDKIVHVFVYSVFTYLLLIGFLKTYQSFKWKYVISVLVFVVFYGGILEILQTYYFVNRNGNIYDFLANILGCIISFGIIFVFNLKKKYN